MLHLALALLGSLLAMLVYAGCGDDDPASSSEDSLTQISGRAVVTSIGPGEDQCLEPPPEFLPVWSVAKITGDLEGCFYSLFESGGCVPGEGGTYTEKGTNLFVGTYHGKAGTFETPYLYTAKLKDCAAYTGEIYGHCEHTITVGSGTADFDGVTGGILMEDLIKAGTYSGFTYTGHLQW